ncbi:amidohydrolase [Cognatishimia sp. WU-CL00825]|uniref:amidohydrolase family protein n=1 Tax=Cognatishimia sp. WU-CL00825 TaxID=3127658 RepID=UPI0031033C69
MTKRDIIDPHHHLWSLEKDKYHWLRKPMPRGIYGDIESISKDYLLSDYRDDTKNYNLCASVHIEAHYDRSAPVEETAWITNVADEFGGPDAIVVYAALEAPNVQEVLDQHLAYGDRIKGVRQILCNHENPSYSFVDRADLMRDARWREGFGRLEGLGLTFDLLVYPHQLADAADLAEAFPETQIILEHGAMPHDRSAEGLAYWRAGLCKLAERENVTIKASGLGQTDWNWTQQSMGSMVCDIVDIFGPKRTMFASNFPVDKVYNSFDAYYAAYEAAVADLSADEKNDLFLGTADRVYRLGVAQN